MTEAEYPEPRVIESASVCAALARLPQLPVRVLVAEDAALSPESARPLSGRLARIADELGVAGAVVVEEIRWAGWPELAREIPRVRFDGLILRGREIPAGAEPELADPDCVETLSAALHAVGARFWVLDLNEDAPDVHRWARLRAFVSTVVDRGGPPGVLVPPDWSDEDAQRFIEGLFERLLHDTALVTAAARATGSLRPPPELYLPEGRRHGLDLGRLLEAHRRRIDETGTALRIFQREVEAARPTDDSEDRQARWMAVRDALAHREEALEHVREGCDEIHRDRDPAGWSRLAQGISDLGRVEAALQGDRDRLAALQEAPPRELG